MLYIAARPERPIRILLVEDDEDDYLITRDLLSNSAQCQYEIHWESKYSSGLAYLTQHQVDACIIDYRIGARTGLEFVQEALATATTVPIILLTGVGDPDIDLAAARMGPPTTWTRASCRASCSSARSGTRFATTRPCSR